MQTVRAGSKDDHRWRPPILPGVPQKEKPPQKVKVADVVKNLKNENAALRQRLNMEIDRNLVLATENKKLKPETQEIAKPEEIVRPKEVKPIEAVKSQPVKPKTKTPKPKRVVRKVAKKVNAKK